VRCSPLHRVHCSLVGISHAYTYDRIGNRLFNDVFERADGVITAAGKITYDFDFNVKRSWNNHLTQVQGPGSRDIIAHDANGAMILRVLLDTNATVTLAGELRETFASDALDLIERYTARSQQAAVSADEDCDLDASTAPLNDWRYRFSPMAEREQKRQYAHFSDSNALAWTYYMLGADAKQLSTWHGIEGDHCTQTNTVWMWPVERNGYGPGNTRIIIRQDSTREYVVADHLGSTRAVLNSAKERLEEHDYEPFGRTLTYEGTGARTSYIGREKDTESDLGSFGVRQYSQDYGRFMSVDPLWGNFYGITPYQYCMNDPTLLVDRSGLAPEDPIWKMASGLGAVVGGVAGVAAGVGLCLLPTGVSQVAGVAVIAASIGGIAFGGAALADATTSYTTGSKMHDIPTGYGDLAGTAIDKGLGGDGTKGSLLLGGIESLFLGGAIIKGSIALGKLGAVGGVVGETAQNLEAPLMGVGALGTVATLVVKDKTVPPIPLLSADELRRRDSVKNTGDGITSPMLQNPADR